MAILGFICLVLLACWLTFTAIGGMVACQAFGGKIDPALWVLAIITAALWYAAYRFSPFTLTIVTP